MSAGPHVTGQQRITIRRRNRPLVAASRRVAPGGSGAPAAVLSRGAGARTVEEPGHFVAEPLVVAIPDPLLDVPLSSETFVPFTFGPAGLEDLDVDEVEAEHGPADAPGTAADEPDPADDPGRSARTTEEGDVGVRVFEGPSRLAVVDADVMTAIRLAIASANHEVLEASRAWAGFDLVVSEQADAVVLSQVLPDSDGLDLVRRFRSYPLTQHLPIVVLGRDESDGAAALAAGADACLAKGAELVEVVDVVSRLLTLSESERARRRAESPAPDGSDLAPMPAPVPTRSWWRRQSA